MIEQNYSPRGDLDGPAVLWAEDQHRGLREMLIQTTASALTLQTNYECYIQKKRPNRPNVVLPSY